MSEHSNSQGFRPQSDGSEDPNSASPVVGSFGTPEPIDSRSGRTPSIQDPQIVDHGMDSDLPEIGDADSSVVYPGSAPAGSAPQYQSPADRNPTVYNGVPGYAQSPSGSAGAGTDTGPIQHLSTATPGSAANLPATGSYPVPPTPMPGVGPVAQPAPMPHSQNPSLPVPMPHQVQSYAAHQQPNASAGWSARTNGNWSTENTGQFRSSGQQGAFGQQVPGQQVPRQQYANQQSTPPHSGQPHYGRPTDTRAIGSYPSGGPGYNPTPVTPRPTTKNEPNRARRSVMLAAATLVLALSAGFGGGLIGANVADSRTSSAVAANDTSLTQRSSAETASTSAKAAAGSVEQVAATVLPSVVSVIAVSDTSGGEGSGVILTNDGYILTNNHVVTGSSQLTVRFNDGSTASAKIVGVDKTSDLAVIKVEGVTGLTPATLGTSADLAVGEQVVAIGTPLGLSATVTTGIVSALNRPVRTASEQSGQQQQQQPGQSTAAASDTVLNAIQTDAAINPGNSGGPLVDMSGKIVGINSAIASLSTSSTSQSGSIGVGFAIPIDSAARVAQEIIKTGSASHAVLGASVSDASSQTLVTTGAKVGSVTAGGPAEAAGLQVGDVVTKVNGVPIESSDALVATIRSSAPGAQIQLSVLRNNSTETVTVTLGTATN